MFNYGSGEIIKLVIQALHQRLSERSCFLFFTHVWGEENIVKTEFSYSFALVFSFNFIYKNVIYLPAIQMYALSNLQQCLVPSYSFYVGVWSSY